MSEPMDDLAGMDDEEIEAIAAIAAAGYDDLDFDDLFDELDGDEWRLAA